LAVQIRNASAPGSVAPDPRLLDWLDLLDLPGRHHIQRPKWPINA